MSTAFIVLIAFIFIFLIVGGGLLYYYLLRRKNKPTPGPTPGPQPTPTPPTPGPTPQPINFNGNIVFYPNPDGTLVSLYNNTLQDLSISFKPLGGTNVITLNIKSKDVILANYPPYTSISFLKYSFAWPGVLTRLNFNNGAVSITSGTILLELNGPSFNVANLTPVPFAIQWKGSDGITTNNKNIPTMSNVSQSIQVTDFLPGAITFIIEGVVSNYTYTDFGGLQSLKIVNNQVTIF